MSASVSISPASGSITHLSTAVNVSCSGVSNNNSAAYDGSVTPSEPELDYYFKIAKTGQDNLLSPRFSTNAAGAAEWHGTIFPAAGTWTLTVNKNSDDTVVATASVVVA